MKRNYETVPLHEVLWFQEGPGVRNTQFRGDGIKLLNVANITKQGMIDLGKTIRYLDHSEVQNKYSHFLADVGDLVIASSGVPIDDDGLLRTRGAFIERDHLPLCMNTSTIRFKSKEGKADLGFFRQWLGSKEFRSQITRLVTGTAQKNFGPSHLSKIQIRLPAIDEQRRIAAILDQADDLRRKRRQVTCELKNLESRLVATAFNAIRSWTTIGEVCDVQGGLQVSSSRFRLPLDIPYLRVANVYRDRLALDEIKTIKLSEAELGRTKLAEGDILFVEGHGNSDEVGRCAVWDGSIDPCVHQNHLIRARVISLSIDPITLSRFLNSPLGRRHLLSRGKTTSGLNTISASDVKTTPVPLIEDDVRQRLIGQLASIAELEAHHRAHLAKLDALFASLQHRAFRGEL